MGSQHYGHLKYTSRARRLPSQLENMQAVVCNLQKELKEANKMIADLRGEPAPSGSHDDDEISAMVIDKPSTSRGHQSWASSRVPCASPPRKSPASNFPPSEEVSSPQRVTLILSQEVPLIFHGMAQFLSHLDPSRLNSGTLNKILCLLSLGFNSEK